MREDAAAIGGEVVGGPDPAAIADELQFLVGALVRQVRAASPSREVTLSQVSILKRLDREGPHAVADLARLDKITHQSVAVSVAGLVDRGLVLRVPDAHDGRRKLLVITDEGKRLLTERQEAGHENLTDAIAGRLSDAERAQLTGALVLLRRLLD
ncbi:MarR family transcriptional regulator [Actinoallomurus purpureus]|uniref:MarR family winged helix-turn-helix transcriptional regulator n=1 Tax=Actinoallomurus purpureus TaxID=478114 RepID=UPI0020923494|nr:MarR family transcriptional regulator [Actinoallomurus purpureus]MCO6009106.1 MarR family transcriptional regulator [Actinoallomurus purpureus]